MMIFAYIDPGAGSMVIQAVLAGLLALPFVFRSTLARVMSRLRRSSRGEDRPETS